MTVELSVDESFGLILKKVFSGISLVSEDGETFNICMRDSGFEFTYNGIWYEAKNGVLKKYSEGEEFKRFENRSGILTDVGGEH